MRTYQQVLATVMAAGYPPLNEEHIRYSLDLGNVGWEVRFHTSGLKIRKRFRSLAIAKIFRDAVIANGYAPEQEFLNPQPKNRNLVNRPYSRKEYTGQDIILGPPTIVRWD